MFDCEHLRAYQLLVKSPSRQKTSFFRSVKSQYQSLTIRHVGHNSAQGFQVMKGLVMMIKGFFDKKAFSYLMHAEHALHIKLIFTKSSFFYVAQNMSKANCEALLLPMNAM